MIKAYKYRLKPNKAQREFFEKSFGCARYVYNWALQKRIDAYQKDKTNIGWVDLCKEITLLKKEKDNYWLNDVIAQSIQSSIRNMDSAFVRFFREKKGFPKFKSKKASRQTFQFFGRISIDFEGKHIKFPKIGRVRFFKNRKFYGKIGMVTVSKSSSGKYYVSIVVDDGKCLPKKSPIKSETAVGVDVGIKDFAVLSNGQVYANEKYLEKAERRLKVLQRRLSRKQKGSNRRERARLCVAHQHEKIHNRRINFIHQVTSRIVSENQTIIIEDLNVDGMLKNHCLAKHISSASWSEFFRQLQYKCEWNGKNLIRIGRFEPSSKMCECGHIYKELKLSQRTWECPACGRKNDRDLLAAQNIKRFGLQNQNLIGITPVVSGKEDVEFPSIDGAVKRQYVKLLNC